ncbi:alkaline phosphatase-like [Glandiceps talaboti]
MKNYFSFLVLCILCQLHASSLAQGPDEWNQQAQATLQNALKLQTLNTNVAKNVVFFLGDGMGIATVTSARIFKGQLNGQPGEETVLNFENLPHVALAKTYNTDAQTADSAGTATAFLTGVKAKSGVISVDDTAEYGDCLSSLNASVDSIVKLAQDAGKSTGIVSTARVTHATPACGYAHSPHRNWENNVDIPPSQRNLGCTDIASQLIDLGRDINVIMGGGRLELLRVSDNDPEYPSLTGQRTDGRNLIDEWQANRPSNSSSYYVWSKQQFDAIDPDTTDYLLGLFETSHMQYEADRSSDTAGEPSLSEMVDKAIRILQKNPNGFLLLVEGGRIDHAHHAGVGYDALMDTIAMDDAVATAHAMTSTSNTLTVVTADHSHTNTIVGYASRGNPILGKVDTDKGSDGLPYTTFMYANGPGGFDVRDSYRTNGTRPDLTDVDTETNSYHQQATIPDTSESHAGEDVAIYADGPMAHLFHGVHEQNYIAHVVMYAACLGTSTEHCTTQATDPPAALTTDPVDDTDDCDPEDSTCGATDIKINVWVFLLLLVPIYMNVMNRPGKL